MVTHRMKPTGTVHIKVKSPRAIFAGNCYGADLLGLIAYVYFLVANAI